MDFLLYKEKIQSKLSKLGLALFETKIINYGEVLEFISDDMFLKITLYYNKKNQFKCVVNKVVPEDKEGVIVAELMSKEKSLLEITDSLNNEDEWHAGSDESGKGDYFGPLVVAAFTCTIKDYQKFNIYGIKDSKLLSDERINLLAEKLFLDYRGQYEYFILMPEQYNELYAKFSQYKPGLNDMLAWMHAKVIGNLSKRHNFNKVTIDKFANEKLIKYYVNKESTLNLNIYTKAESDLTVAAASIIARYLYVKSLDELSKKYGIDFLKGASKRVKEQKMELTTDILPFVCKMHFK